LIWMVAPVRGLRPVRPARVLASKIPRPAIETSSPRFKYSVTPEMIASTARSASALVQPIVECTRSMRSALFAINLIRNINKCCKRSLFSTHRTILGRIFWLSIVSSALSTWVKRDGDPLEGLRVLVEMCVHDEQIPVIGTHLTDVVPQKQRNRYLRPLVLLSGPLLVFPVPRLRYRTSVSG
jgi:hypothetical protein